MKTHYDNLLKYLVLFLYIGLSTIFAAAPVVVSTPITTIYEDSLYSYELHASDADGDTLTWSVTSGTALPSWLDLNAVSTWNSIGSTGFSASSARYTSIALDSNNTPYVVYQDAENSGKATVQKFDGNSWVTVGNAGFSAGATSYTSIVLDSNNTPYVVYRDGGNSDKTTVQKFDGNSWVTVGNAGFSVDQANYTAIAIDSHDSPYVVYIDYGNNVKATVMKFDGSSWVTVGSAGFSANRVDYTSIAIDSNDAPYVVYQDYYNAHKATVMKFDGSSWVTVGSAGFSADEADYTSIAIDSNDTPYVAYKDWGNGFKATVMKFDGNSWVTVGNAGFSASSADYTAIAIDSNNTPYVVYLDYGHSHKATVMKFDGNSWVTASTAGFSAGAVEYTSIAIDSNDTSYVVYQDGENNDTSTVMQLTTTVTLTGTPTNDDVGVYDINLTLTDGTSDVYHNFTITVHNTNDAPTDINISNNNIAEENTIGDTIGTLATTDVDVGDSFTYAFCGGVDDANFSIDGDTLKANSVFDYDVKNSYRICLLTSDSAAATFQKNFTINIKTKPTITSTALTTVDEDSVYAYKLHASDVDNDTLTWSVTSGSTLPSWLDLNGTVSDWSYVGNAGFSASSVNYTAIAIDSNNTPYVVYRDGGNSYKATVQKFDGNSWVAVGNAGFSAGTANHTAIAIDSNNTPYVVYQDAENSGKATVQKFDGNSWVTVGNAGFSADRVHYTSIAIDSNNTPYVVYKDRGNGSRATVQKFDGNNWIIVGSAGFSAGLADYTNILIDSHDSPYVVYKDYGNNGKATVMKFNGNSWVNVGNAGFSAGQASHTSIVLDSNNTPYVVYQDSGNSNKATVMKLDGNSWITVGSAGFSAGTASYTSIVLDSNDTPYVTYKDGEHGDKATLMKFDGSNWLTAGSAGFSAGSTSYTSIVLDSHNIPYVVYKDVENIYKVTVQKFTTATLVGTPTNDDVGVYDINLTLTDGTSDVYHNFTITVNNTNDAPTDINISNKQIIEENTIGDTIGTLATTDVDVGDSFTYAFCGGVDDANFSIDGDTLKANSVFDYDVKNSYSICLQTSDSAAATYNKNFTINIKSKPTVTSTALTTADEDSLYSYELHANNADGDTLTWSVTSGTTLPSWLNFPSWVTVGITGFSAGSVDYTSMAIDSNDTPYVVYQDHGNSDKATVMKFDGSSWVTVGNAGFSTGAVEYTSIAIDSNDIPYVVYIDGENSIKATVMKFDGSSWVTVGNAGFSSGEVYYTAIAIDSNNTPYVVYQDGANSDKATVQKFDGSSWVTVGNAGFSAGSAKYTAIAIDSNNTPYVVYRNGGNSYRATVMKFDGNSWVTVGNAGFSTANYTAIAIDSNNTPYVVYQDMGHSDKATVMKFNGSSWVTVGNAGFSAGLASYTSIVLDSNDTPYVVYEDNGNSHKATVMKFDGNSWVTVGNVGFSAGQASFTSIVLDSNDTPYVVYEDRENSYKATAKKFTTVTLIGTPTNDDVGVYDINLTLTDGTSDVYHNFTITVHNTNDAPTDINISNNFIAEKNTIGDTIGTLATTDVDVGDSFTYAFCGGVDDANFSIDGDTLKANSVFDYDVKNSYSICLQTSDSAAATFQKNFTINIKSKPTVTSTALTTVDEDSLYSYELHANNADGDTLTWSVTSGSALPSWLNLNGTVSDWSRVGNAGFSVGSAFHISIALDSNNIPYIVYQDSGNSNKATVMKFDGNSWVDVGNAGFSTGAVEYTSIAIDSNNTPYVVYRDGGNSHKATVKKFDGNSWVTVGNAGFSADNAYYTSIAIDSNNTPYVVYQDGGNNDKATVMKFDGNSWVNVGNAGFSAGTVHYTSIAIDSNNTPYVTYKDDGNGNKSTVMKFDGNSWVTVGNAGFSAGTANYTAIAIDSNNTPYVVYQDVGHSSKATVMKFNGSSWITVGSAGFSADRVHYTSIAIDSNNTPYVTYKDDGNSYKSTVMKFDGNSWVTVGNVGFSAGFAEYTAITIDSTDIPYVVYADGEDNYRATVKRFTTVTLTGTPTNNDVGVHNINLTLTDGISNVAHNFTVTVNNVNDAPVLSTIANQSKLEDFGNYTIQLNATDIDSNTLTYSASSSNPNIATVNVNGASLTLTSVANANGVVQINYSVSDGFLSDSKSFELDVTAVDDAPTLDALANIARLEDASQSNIILSAYDMENNPITYTASSSNPSIVKVSIVNGHLIVTQLPNASGVVNIEVNATANGQTATQHFDVDVTAVNDAPSIDTQLPDITILEDASSFSVDMNVSDVDGDALTIGVVSDNNTLVRLTPNWINPLNQAAYSQTLNFTIAAAPNANGSANITLTVDDGTTSRSQTFTLNVTPVNDAPQLEPLADRIYYNNFTDKHITLNASDSDDINLTYSASIGTSDIIDSATLSVNILTLKSLSGAYGDTNVTVSVSDEHGENSLTSSQTFHLRVLSIESGNAQEEVISTDINETNTSTTYSDTIKTKDFEIVVKRVENKDGSVAQEMLVGEKVVKATSDLNGSKVAMTPEGVHTLYDDANVRAEVIATLTGEATQKITVNGKTTEATSEVIGATTHMTKDTEGNIEIITTLKNSDNTISVVTKADGTAEYTVQNGLKTTKIVSKIPGAKTVIKAGYIETIVDGEPVDGVFFRAIVRTKIDGTTVSSFEKINSDGTVIETFDTFSPTTPYDAGNQIVIQKIGSKTYIVATTPLSANRLRVE